MRLISALVLLGLASLSRAETSDFVHSDAKLEKLWGDGEFTEGPCLGPDSRIYFSDIGNRIMKFDPQTLKTTVFREPSGRANGLKFDLQGRMIACEGANTGGKRRISINTLEKDGTVQRVQTLADKYKGEAFNSPNDLTIDARQSIYFTDPRYVGDEKRGLEHESVYRIDTSSGTVTRIISDCSKPNGIAISPDQKTLYIAESPVAPKGQRQLRAYPLNEDGSVGMGRVLFDFGEDRGIDGMAVAVDGHLFAAAGKGKTAGVIIFSPEGKKVGIIAMPEDPSNCCFGGKDMKMLYITAGKSLYRIPTKVAGGDSRVLPKK